MKTSILLSFALAFPLFAQNPAGPQPPVVRRMAAQPVQQAPAEVRNQLAENVTVHIKGQILPGITVDNSITGIGPSFTVQKPGENGSILNLSFMISEAESGYVVQYAVGAKIKIPLSGQNYEYRDVSMTGTIKCLPAKAVVLAQDGETPLSLTITPVDSGK